MKKILFSVFFIMILIITAEGSYYLGYNSSQNKQPNTQNVVQTPKITPSLSKEDLAILEDPYYRYFLPFSYDEEKDKIYIDVLPRDFISWRKKMGMDFASMIANSSFTKGQLESMIMIVRLGGTIKKLDTNKIVDGKRNLFFVLKGKDDSYSEFTYNENFIKKAKFIKMIDGKEIAMNWETDLQNNDNIVIEARTDPTKPPKDPMAILEAKLIKL